MNGEPANLDVDQLDFEFVLFASALIDYDYIMKLIAKYSGQDPKTLTISREQLIGLIRPTPSSSTNGKRSPSTSAHSRRARASTRPRSAPATSSSRPRSRPGRSKASPRPTV